MNLSALVAIEWRKLLRCKPFWVVLAIGIVCATMAAVGEVASYLQEEPARASMMEYTYQQPFALSPYTRWIPVDRIEFWANLFVFIAPMLIALAYSWSLRSELLSGYAQKLYVTVTRPRYYLSKALVTFVAGGLIVAVPLVIDFVILACFLPLCDSLWHLQSSSPIPAVLSGPLGICRRSPAHRLCSCGTMGNACVGVVPLLAQPHHSYGRPLSGPHCPEVWQ